jgi:hypothetical protein
MRGKTPEEIAARLTDGCAAGSAIQRIGTLLNSLLNPWFPLGGLASKTLQQLLVFFLQRGQAGLHACNPFAEAVTLSKKPDT